MSNFKKMRLVEDNQPNNRDLFSQFTTSPTVQRLSELDIEIRDILNREINEREKAKLYSQTLRKFLIYKQKHEDEENILKQKELELLTKRTSVLNTPVKKGSTKKKKKKKKARILFSTPYKTPRLLDRLSRSSNKERNKKKQTKPKTTIVSANIKPTATVSDAYDEYRKIETPEMGSTNGWDTYQRNRYNLN